MKIIFPLAGLYIKELGFRAPTIQQLPVTQFHGDLFGSP
jgi:hypothetical protein